MRRPVVLGCGGLFLLVVVAGAVLGVDSTEFLRLLSADTSSPGYETPLPDVPAGQPLANEPARFVSVVLADTEDAWFPIFERSGRRYEPPTLVLFTDAVDSACGFGTPGASPGPEANALSVRLELRARCFAGMWGYDAEVERGPSRTRAHRGRAARRRGHWRPFHFRYTLPR